VVLALGAGGAPASPGGATLVAICDGTPALASAGSCTEAAEGAALVPLEGVPLTEAPSALALAKAALGKLVPEVAERLSVAPAVDVAEASAVKLLGFDELQPVLMRNRTTQQVQG
jgi:hypothetical protein